MNHKTSTSRAAGQGMVEYIILVAIIAIASLGIVKILGDTVTKKLAQVTLALQGRSTQARRYEPPAVQERHTQGRGMDDFYESSEE